MKIYLIKFNKCDYDQYGGFVIVAENKEEVIKIIKSKIGDYLIDWKSGYKVEEIKPESYKKGIIVLEDFKAG